MSFCLRTVCLLVLAAWGGTALAADAYFDIPLRELKLADGKLPARDSDHSYQYYERADATAPYAILDGEGEAYVMAEGGSHVWPYVETDTLHLFVRAPEGKDLAGRLFVSKPDRSGMEALRFTAPASAAKPDAKKTMLRAKIERYEHLLRRDIPGAAWFRHQARLAHAELGEKQEDQPTARWRPTGGDELTRTFDLFTGSRAMSENLQLDRELPRARPNETPVKIDSLPGITINEIDWKPLLKDAAPKLDPLAEKVPADQHVIFFPDFQKAMAMADEMNRHDTPVLRAAQPRSEDARVIQRYQRQLGLTMSDLARLLGPKVVRSVALTGSDPYLLVGTDVAVIFEAPQPVVLEKLILGRIAMAAAQAKGAKPVSGEAAGVKYAGFLAPDRSTSSYVARLEGAVVVTNSTYQLSRIVEASKDKAKSIASLPEYAFFRERYKLGDPEETALAFVSDPAIRRWCGPGWRIADSRRTRARAVLAELQASQLDALVKNSVRPGPIHTDLPILGGGELELAASGVRSTTFGTLPFMTPIGETPLSEVTQAEADAYRTWRDGYQRNWSWGFDPIAVRISLGKEKAAADLTVMPLIMSTQYHEMISLSSGGQFDPTAGDPHEALAQLMLAINRDSPLFKQGENFASMMGQAVSLGWMGRWVSVFAEDDPLWKELEQVREKDLGAFFEKNVGRLPIAVQFDVSNPLKLAVFLTSARAFMEQSSPGLVQWEALKYKDQAYVRITPVKGKGTVPRELEELAIYYTTAPDALTVTLSEKVLERTIDRRLARQAANEEKKPAAPSAKAWLGQNVSLRVDRRILDVANALSRRHYQSAMQMRCWGNLPILNEWKRLYPDRDPVKVHEAVWGVELVCPAGGKYVWNDEFQTMESTVYGHPGEPKEGPPAPPVLSSFTRGEFGLTFENKGLRAQTVLERESPKPAEGKK